MTSMLVSISTTPGPGISNGNSEVFVWNRPLGTFSQITDTGDLVFHTFVDIDPSGAHLIYERLDSVFATFEVFHQRISVPGVENSVVVAGSTFPVVTTTGADAPVAIFQSVEDHASTNADGNSEIFFTFPP